MVVSREGYGHRQELGEEKVHDYFARPEVWRQRHEDLLKEVENARLVREIRRRRKGASREWRINLGRWILQLRRIPEYEANPAAKS
jgi:hypothetical protein